MTTSLRGSVRIVPPSSPAHALLDLSRPEEMRVQVDLYRLCPLEGEEAADVPPRAMSMEACMEARLAPFRSVLRAAHSGLQQPAVAAAAGCDRPSQHHYSFSFDALPAGRYHVLAFTVPKGLGTEAEGEPARFTDPQQQSFGFCSEGGAGGNRWPWSVLQLGGAGSDGAAPPAERVLEPFPLRVAHSFAVLRPAADPASAAAAAATPAAAVPTRVPHASLRLLPGSTIPALQLGRCKPGERGLGHGRLLAPYILDFWRFYIFEHRFAANAARYEAFVDRWVRPARGFFSYPPDALEEAHGVVEGMRRAAAASAAAGGNGGVDLFLEEVGREIDVGDILAGYIETRTVVSTEVQQQQAQAGTEVAAEDKAAAAASSSAAGPAPAPAPADAALAHHCSQAVLWGPLTAGSGGSVVAGRNMDGEIDFRKVTATHSILIATDRDPAPEPEPQAEAAAASASTSGTSSSPAPKNSFRTISLMWPGLVGTLTGVNETGLYMCENAGETQPGTGLVSGLTPVACVQQAALRALDGRTLTPAAMRAFLEKYVSRAGWDPVRHAPLSEEAREEQLRRAALPRYASHTRGGFSGPGSIFVVATPPVPSASASAASAAVPAPAASAAVSATDRVHGFVVEADRSHTALRLPGTSLPLDVATCVLATNHALALGFDDQGVLGPEAERRRAPLWPADKCPSIHAHYSGAAANARFTNWNVPVAAKSFWRFEAGRNRLQALDRLRRQASAAALAGSSHSTSLAPTPSHSMSIDTVRSLLQSMCPGYTEHSFMVDLRPDGGVRVHVAVAAPLVGMWDAPYARWFDFEFADLFVEDVDKEDESAVHADACSTTARA